MISRIPAIAFHSLPISNQGMHPLVIESDFYHCHIKYTFLFQHSSGKYVMEDLHNVGGTPAVLKYLLKEGLLNGDCLTVTGKTLAENLAEVPDLKSGQDVIRPLNNPIKKTGHIQILRGNLS